MTVRKFLQCSAKVNKNAVRREVIDGVEHIIVSSFTLPDDVVMNGGLYPADEIANSFETLERTLAPVEHPSKNGMFVSANDPFAINNFYAGAWNQNARRENGRVHVDKVINVQEAKKTDRGRRLLDRIDELETSEKPRPIHTSTGVFLEVEPLGEMKTNAAGDEYDWIARNMVFDHDAILLDTVAAATPEKGVGMAVNLEGDLVDVESAVIDIEEAEDEGNRISLRELEADLEGAIYDVVTVDYAFLVDVIDEQAVFETSAGFLQVPFRISGGRVTITGVPIRVEKIVKFLPKVNRQDTKGIKKQIKGDLYLIYQENTTDEGEAMKEKILAALAAANIATNGLSDDELLAKYDELQANQQNRDGGDQGQGDDLSEVVTNALKPLTEKLEGLEAQINSQAEAEKARYIEVIVNSDKYPEFDEDTAKLLPVEKLKAMAANCGVAYGVPAFNSGDQSGAKSFESLEMPE